jgi:hypothetical protein
MPTITTKFAPHQAVRLTLPTPDATAVRAVVVALTVMTEPSTGMPMEDEYAVMWHGPNGPHMMAVPPKDLTAIDGARGIEVTAPYGIGDWVMYDAERDGDIVHVPARVIGYEVTANADGTPTVGTYRIEYSIGMGISKLAVNLDELTPYHATEGATA